MNISGLEEIHADIELAKRGYRGGLEPDSPCRQFLLQHISNPWVKYCRMVDAQAICAVDFKGEVVGVFTW